jgi:hypothetical protein
MKRRGGKGRVIKTEKGENTIKTETQKRQQRANKKKEKKLT